MKTKNKKWFTLVELIVVVTILAILSTFAFLSFQKYTRDARNAKRNMELWNIEKQIELSMMQWVNLFTMIASTWSTIQNNSWTALRIWWIEGYNSLSWVYKAWDIQFSVLQLDAEKYKDPKSGSTYKLWATTHGTRYELAATIETDLWGDSLIKWSYYARTSAGNRIPLDSSQNNTWSTVLIMAPGSSFLESWLIIWDVVKVASWSTTPDYTITSVNGNQVSISPPLDLKGQNLYLKWDETRSLIKAWRNFASWHQAIKVWVWDIDYLPYKLEP